MVGSEETFGYHEQQENEKNWYYRSVVLKINIFFIFLYVTYRIDHAIIVKHSTMI